MTPEQLIEQCEAVLAEGGDRITLVVPKGKSSRLPGCGRPELLCEQHDGSRVFSYDARKMLDAIRQAVSGA